MKFITALTAFLSVHSQACTCSEDVAFSKGFKAIVENGWATEVQLQEFELVVHGTSYVVTPKGLRKDQRGGGHPEATVNQENCEVTSVSLAR